MSDLSRRRFLAGTAAVGAATSLGGLTLVRSAGAQAAPPAAPRLASGADPARSMWLSWSTPGPVAGARVDLGLDAGYGTSLPIDTRAVGGVTNRYAHALADGLEPATTYHWRIAHDGAPPVTGTLTTAAVDRVPFRFVAFGDQGDGTAAEAVGAVVAGLQPAPALVFLVGDLSYASKSGGVLPSIPGVIVDDAVWDAWLDLASRAGASAVPWLGGVGNHEMEEGRGELGYDGYLARVALPGNGPAGIPTAWTARHGNVAFVNVDANDVSLEITRNRGWTGGAQTAWLDATLAGLRADPGIDWIVVGFHHCAYCSNAVHASDGGVRQQWEALFDRHQVDLVVNGHNHCYERTHAMRGGEAVAEVPAGGTLDGAAGTTYVTAGGGGQQSYPTFLAPASYVTVDGGLRLPEVATWSAVRSTANSLLYADVDPGEPGGTTTMAIVALDVAGAVIDRLTLARARSGALPSPSPAAGPDAASDATGEVRAASGPLPATGGVGAGAAAAAALAAAAAARRVVTG